MLSEPGGETEILLLKHKAKKGKENTRKRKGGILKYESVGRSREDPNGMGLGGG